MTAIDAWKQGLWELLDALPPEDQYVIAGELIHYLSRTMLPELGLRRRENIMAIMANGNMTAAEVADTLGMRRSTVIRLLEEGRAAHRPKHARAELEENDVQPEAA